MLFLFIKTIFYRMSFSIFRYQKDQCEKVWWKKKKSPINGVSKPKSPLYITHWGEEVALNCVPTDCTYTTGADKAVDGFHFRKLVKKQAEGSLSTSHVGDIKYLFATERIVWGIGFATEDSNPRRPIGTDSLPTLEPWLDNGSNESVTSDHVIY